MVDIENVIFLLRTNELIVQSYDYNRKSGRFWVIIEPLTVKLTTGDIISIPKGFCYDMATVPPFMWSIIKPYDDALMAYLIHDWLYMNQKAHFLTRKQVDKEMLQWAKRTNTNSLNNYIRYFFVRLFGWIYWKKIL